MKKQTSNLLIAVLIIFQLYSCLKINSLESMMRNTNNTIDSIGNSLGNQINSIYRNVDQKLNKQASLIHHSSTKVGKLDVSNITVPITFTVEPKSVTETMSVYLDFNGEILPLEKSAVKYYTTKNFKISEEIFPTIIIEDNGVKRMEDHNGLMISNLKENIFPNISARFIGETSYSLKDYRQKGKVDIDYNLVQKNNPFIDIKYVIKVDDEIIKEVPVEIEKESSIVGTYTLNIDEKYSLNDGQILTSNVVAVDSIGFTYEYLVTHYTSGSDSQREPYFEKVNIIAPDGKVY